MNFLFLPGDATCLLFFVMLYRICTACILKNNSFEKKRQRPGAQAARVGSAVKWQPDF